VALAALGRVEDAKGEQQKFRDGAADVPADRRMAINTAHDVFDVADHMLDGEICWAQGDTEGAVTHLHTAIELEDKLAYMEPPEWAIPVRHALGAILLKSGRVDEAEADYREDLKHWPDNGWSLHGLADCLEKKSGGASEAAQLRERFKKEWAQADVAIETSCLCVKRG
jgi:Flp pilus assembly protein TadD